MASDEFTYEHVFDMLKRDMHATSQEINYLKTLFKLIPQERLLKTDDQNFLLPSMIIDDFLYHGDYEHARNTKLLTNCGIRHIISIWDFPLGKDMFDTYNILWINAKDSPDYNIRKYFDQTNDFLHACKNKNERVLVHCQMGISRSSSIVLAYLMKYHYHTVHKAYAYLVARRHIALPNDGFFIQLIRYENDLQKTKSSETKQNSTKSKANK
ncbi:unnamed protein product [Rotaria socialis]|uniref:protein-tyrosine-phosphatase n=1 Tax=Rotaria socialis TaxID=392032 RepID=A0A820USX4_9BILA|nr:unnamed protein product [Rotaria socialis]CAF3422426.1 unnamed protein product [Rotaria socialis]CAF4434208.1 unnamed protein product [Rotaria socialis]CAF4489814.1 unnamed protein product [Rotaria socialis]